LNTSQAKPTVGPKLFAIGLVQPAVDEGDRRVRIPQHLLEALVVQHREEAQVVVFAHRAVVLPLEAVAQREARLEPPAVLDERAMLFSV